MSTITLTEVTLYAFCGDALCPGYVQQEVEGIHNLTTHTYGDAGAEDAFQGFVQRTNDYYQFKDEERDGTCPHCQGPRQVSPQVRPEYPSLAAKVEERRAKGDTQDVSVTKLYLDERLKREESDAKLAKLEAMVEKLAEEPKRGPGRPPKAVD